MFDVVITTYNRAEYVVAAVRSCLGGKSQLRKVIVVDDCSTDDTILRLSEIADERLQVCVRERNGGIGAARADGFALSQADWTLMLDSDHELMPEGLNGLAVVVRSVSSEVGIVGARFLWDDGKVSPEVVPPEVLSYAERIKWCCVPNSIGTDFVCCIRRDVREAVTWCSLRGGLTDVLFHLDAAKVKPAFYSPVCIAYQKSHAPHSYSRAPASARFRGRVTDASDMVRVFELILNRHERALRHHGKTLAGSLYLRGAYAAFLSGDARRAARWLCESVEAKGLTGDGVGLFAGLIFGRRVFQGMYVLRDCLRRLPVLFSQVRTATAGRGTAS